MIKVFISSQSSYRFDRERMRKAVEGTLVAHGITEDMEVSLAVVGQRKMRELHKKYLETDETTDVLSFPTYDELQLNTPFVFPPNLGGKILGDIVVCYPVAVVQAAEGNHLVDEEMEFLVKHSCLHLLGIHHE